MKRFFLLLLTLSLPISLCAMSPHERRAYLREMKLRRDIIRVKADRAKDLLMLYRSAPELLDVLDADTHESLLHKAVRDGDDLSASVFAKLKRDLVHHTNKDDDSPLHIAAQKGDFKTVRVLLNYGADPELVNLEQHTPITLARKHKHKAVENMLLEHIEENKENYDEEPLARARKRKQTINRTYVLPGDSSDDSHVSYGHKKQKVRPLRQTREW